MKHIRIFSIVFLLAFLSLPSFDALACDELIAAVAAAQEAVNEAEKARTAVTFELLLKSTTQAAGEATNNAVGEDVVRVKADNERITQLAFDRVEAQEALDAARNSLTAVQVSLDNCLGNEKRTCGCPKSATHDVTSCNCDYKTWNGFCGCSTSVNTITDCGHSPTHPKTNHYSCNHWDFVCKVSDHSTTTCPLSPSGERCTVGFGYYRKCLRHEHSYPSDLGSGSGSDPNRCPKCGRLHTQG